MVLIISTFCACYLRIILHIALCLIVHYPTGRAFLPEGFYCGRDNCYDVLGIDREADRSIISKSYRKLAIKFHPDKQKGTEEEKQKAAEHFHLIAAAYETLKDDEVRKNYDYMLDHPDETYRHYYYYYRNRVAPKVDVRIVILATVLIISAIQYVSAWQKYNEAISYLFSQPKYRIRATEIAKERGLLPRDNVKKGKRTKADKEEAKEEEEAIIKSIIQENIDLRGGYKKPNPLDVFVFQIIIFPYTAFLYAKWYLRWLWKFRICKEEFGEEERLHLIRKSMKLSHSQFECLERSDIESFLSEELWIKENFDRWQKNKEEQERAKLAENAQHKRYRRFMKRGPGQMTFLED